MTHLSAGAIAPDFTLKDQNNRAVRLADFRGRKAVLLVFFPLAFTGTCGRELDEISAHLSDYATTDVQVLTVSVDSPYSHKVWADREGYAFPLLADFWPHGAVAQAYGVFDAVAGFANRGTFLVGSDGVIRFAEMVGPGEARDQARWRAVLAELRSEPGRTVR